MGECTVGSDALRSLIEAEYAFAARAGVSVRSAFLDNLAEDSLVLQPAPTPGRAFYGSAKDDGGRLAWYPASADLAGSGDLGFTAGPWTYTSAAGAELHGHYLTVWKRDTACRWWIEFDGGISHAAPASAEPQLSPGRVAYTPRSPPSQTLIADDALSHAIDDFQETTRQNGMAPGLRTYARTADFCLYLDGEPPMELAVANRQFSDRTLAGGWAEDARGRSFDSSLAYSVGVVGVNRPSSHAYVQIWQYAPKVANWGLRLLLIDPLPPPVSK